VCGTRRGAGRYEKRLEAGERPPKTGIAIGATSRTEPGELREQWQSLFGANPPPKLRASLLIQAIAYRLQEQALGGLKPATLRLLNRIADDATARRVTKNPERIRLTAGTTLIREWHGTKHQVTVLEEGFLYHAKRFRSLSLIARTITGSRWSGPLFFGLKSSQKGQNREAA
jgi:hypothetical protein